MHTQMLSTMRLYKCMVMSKPTTHRDQQPVWVQLAALCRYLRHALWIRYNKTALNCPMLDGGALLATSTVVNHH